MTLKALVRAFMPVIVLKRYRYIRYGGWKRFYRGELAARLEIKAGGYAGKRCFIIGNGPSVNQMDLSRLDNEHVMIVNRGYLLLARGLKHADFYGISDRGAYAEYGKDIPVDVAEHICLFGAIPWGGAVERLNIIPMYKEECRHKHMSRGFFQFRLPRPVAHTYTVVLQMLQMAVYAGFKEIYFIGVDNDFTGANMHFYKDSQQEKRNMEVWGKDPSLDNDMAFEKAFHILRKNGVALFNAGIGGNLNALPRVNFESLFDDEDS